MRRKLAALIGLVCAFALAAPTAAITTGQPDNNEHPYVGELLFYVPDAADSRFDEPGQLVQLQWNVAQPHRVIVTAGHCAFGVGLDGVSTTHGGSDRRPPPRVGSRRQRHLDRLQRGRPLRRVPAEFELRAGAKTPGGMPIAWRG